jgi:hypothetical protein
MRLIFSTNLRVIPFVEQYYNLIDFAKLNATDGMKTVCIPLLHRLNCVLLITLAATQHSGSTEAAAAAVQVLLDLHGPLQDSHACERVMQTVSGMLG